MNCLRILWITDDAPGMLFCSVLNGQRALRGSTLVSGFSGELRSEWVGRLRLPKQWEEGKKWMVIRERLTRRCDLSLLAISSLTRRTPSMRKCHSLQSRKIPAGVPMMLARFSIEVGGARQAWLEVDGTWLARQRRKDLPEYVRGARARNVAAGLPFEQRSGRKVGGTKGGRQNGTKV